jgi:hypothetical protein
MRQTIPEQIHSLTSLADGLQKNYRGRSILLGGSRHKTSDLVARCRKIVAAHGASAAALAKYLETAREAKRLYAESRGIFSDLRAYLWMSEGNHPKKLGDYGLAPRKPSGAKSVRVKAAAADKRLATRKARHTTGKRQKKQVKGAKPDAGPAS